MASDRGGRRLKGHGSKQEYVHLDEMSYQDMYTFTHTHTHTHTNTYTHTHTLNIHTSALSLAYDIQTIHMHECQIGSAFCPNTLTGGTLHSVTTSLDCSSMSMDPRRPIGVVLATGWQNIHPRMLG